MRIKKELLQKLSRLSNLYKSKDEYRSFNGVVNLKLLENDDIKVCLTDSVTMTLFAFNCPELTHYLKCKSEFLDYNRGYNIDFNKFRFKKTELNEYITLEENKDFTFIRKDFPRYEQIVPQAMTKLGELLEDNDQTLRYIYFNPKYFKTIERISDYLNIKKLKLTSYGKKRPMRFDSFDCNTIILFMPLNVKE